MDEGNLPSKNMRTAIYVQATTTMLTVVMGSPIQWAGTNGWMADCTENEEKRSEWLFLRKVPGGDRTIHLFPCLL